MERDLKYRGSSGIEEKNGEEGAQDGYKVHLREWEHLGEAEAEFSLE